MAEAAGIFVSHAHEDNAWCRTFVEMLRQAGASVWYDEHNLSHGVLGEEIERELKARPSFIVILSPASVSSPWVRQEMNGAIHLRRQNPERVILPVVAEKTEVPLFWEEYKRLCGPGDSGLSAREAAGWVVHTLGIGLGGPRPVPETAEEATTRGNGLITQHRYEEALATFERALTLDSQSALAWNGKGDALNNLQHYDEALSAYEQALTLDPKNAFAWNSEGNTLASLGRHEEALSAYEQVLALDPKNAIAWTNKIAILRHLRRRAEAQEAKRQRDEALRSQ